MPLPSQCFVPGSRSCCCKAFSAGWNLVAALSRTGGRLHCPALLQSRLLVWGASINSSETTFAGLNYHQLLIANQTGVPQTITKYWTIQIRDKRQGRESQADWDKIPTFAVCLNASPKPILCARSVLNFEPTLRYCVQMSKCQKQVKCTMFPSQLDKVLPRAKMNI